LNIGESEIMRVTDKIADRGKGFKEERGFYKKTSNVEY
jgi:hypothetical protein